MKRLLSILLLIVGLGFFIQAHNRSDFSDERQKPNSLIYYQNADEEKSYWVTYDKMLDDWTRGYLGEAPEEASKYIQPAAGSKYNTSYRYAAEAPHKDIDPFEIRLETDSLNGSERDVSFTIIPKREVAELFIYADTAYTYSKLSFNGQDAVKDDKGKIHANIRNKRLMRYYLNKNDSLNIVYTTSQRDDFEFTVLEYSYDLLNHPQFTINKRPAHMMAKPFINTDAIVVKRSFSIGDLRIQEVDTLNYEVEDLLGEE